MASVLVCLGCVGGGNGGLQSSIVCDDRTSHTLHASGAGCGFALQPFHSGIQAKAGPSICTSARFAAGRETG